MARPRRQNAVGRTVRYELRLSEPERAALTAAAAGRGVTPADLLRGAFLGSAAASHGPGQASRPAPLLDPAAIAGLNRVGANLNQVARRIHAGDVIQPGEVPEVLADIARQLDRIEALVFAAIDP